MIWVHNKNKKKNLDVQELIKGEAKPRIGDNTRIIRKQEGAWEWHVRWWIIRNKKKKKKKVLCI